MGVGLWLNKHLVNPYSLGFGVMIGLVAIGLVSITSSIFIWQFGFEHHHSGTSMGSDVEPNRKHFLAEQLQEEWNDDRRFFSDVSRIEQELKSLQDIAPIPTNTINADFDRDVNTIETTIREIEKQFPR